MATDTLIEYLAVYPKVECAVAGEASVVVVDASDMMDQTPAAGGY